jgi:FkbM family methyltransferase
MQFGPLTLKRCRYGWMLFSGPFIGKCFDLYGEYSEAEVALMRAFVREGDVVIDVGANIGDLTLPLAQMVGAKGRVYAVESHARHFNVLCANLALNGIANTNPINAFVASSDQVDTASPVWGPNAFVSETWGASFMALDDLDLPSCRLIKVDVDGKELEVLMSAEMLIERFRPVLYVENDVREASPALIEFIQRKLGYRLYWHPAPIFRPDNFFGNPANHWEPRNIVSLMMLGLPAEMDAGHDQLSAVKGPQDWWQP